MTQASKEAYKKRVGDQRPDRNNTERPNTRIPIAEARDKLSVLGQDPTRYYRWVNDVESGQRIALFQQAGYRIENDPNLKIGTVRTADTDGQGSEHKKYVGIGKQNLPIFAYLMSIPLEFYNEDQEKKMTEIDLQEQQMKRYISGVDYVKEMSIRGDTKSYGIND